MTRTPALAFAAASARLLAGILWLVQPAISMPNDDLSAESSAGLARKRSATLVEEQQDPQTRRAIARFDEAWRQVQQTASPEAAAAAADRFLQLPEGAARTERLAAGARCNLLAGRLRIAAEVSDGHDKQPAMLEVHLRALAGLEQLEAFVAVASRTVANREAASPATQDAANTVLRVLVAEEPRLLPLAAAALRNTRTRAAGRFVFEQLAMAATANMPALSYRLGNYALCLRQIGELEAAHEVYAQGREQAPNDLELWNDYGLLLRATGKIDDAIAAFRRSVALDQARPIVARGRGPAITNLMHLEALLPDPGADGLSGSKLQPDPVPDAIQALQIRPSATLLRRLYLDVQLDRLATKTGRLR